MKRINIFIIFFILIAVGNWCEAGTWSQSTKEAFDTNTFTTNVDANDGTISLNAAYSSADANTVLLMHFDEGSGVPTDSSSYGNNGITNGAAWTNDGKFWKALSFDGSSNSYVNCGSNNSLDIVSAITIEAWIKCPGTASYYFFVSKENATFTDGYDCHLVNGNFRLELGKSAASATLSLIGTSDLRDNVWHHVAAIWDGTYAYVYVDGNLLNSSYYVGGIGASTGKNLTVGARNNGSSRFLGLIDEVRISNKARTLSEMNTSGSTIVSGTTGTVTSPPINSSEPITNIRLDWEDEVPAGTSITYSATNDGGVHWYELPGDNVLFTFPSPGTDLRVKAELRSGSGSPTLNSWSAEFSGDPYGAVYDAITGQAIMGAQVILHTPDGSIYSGTPQDNPQLTDGLGRYNFYAEKGKYYITATVQGYSDYTSDIFTEAGGSVLVNVNMEPFDYVDENGLLISQTANKTSAKRGDIITYFFKIKNTKGPHPSLR